MHLSCPLYRGCPYLGRSFIGGFTVHPVQTTLKEVNLSIKDERLKVTSMSLIQCTWRSESAGILIHLR